MLDHEADRDQDRRATQQPTRGRRHWIKPLNPRLKIAAPA